MRRVLRQDDRAAPGWPRGFVVAQPPNALLAGALLAGLAGIVLDGNAADVARALHYVLLGAWSWDEAAHGVNWFRRLLGALLLVFAVARVAQAFG